MLTCFLLSAMTSRPGRPPLSSAMHTAPVNKESFMTLKPSYLSFSAAKRLALFSPLLCLLLLTACAPQQSGLQHHQYSIVRYQDSLTALHDYRPPTREALSYTARRELQTAGAAVSQNGSNVRFTPSPMKNSTTATLKSRRNCSRNRRSTRLFRSSSPSRKLSGSRRPSAPASIPSNAGRLMHAGVDTPETAGKKSLLPRPAKSCTAAAKAPMA